MIPEIWISKAYGRQAMISAQGEAKAQICKLAYDKFDSRHVWLYSDVNHIYCGFPFNTQSRGMGGAKITYTYIDATDCLHQITIHGPWCTGADELFAHTGVDLRNKYPTRGLLAYKRTYDSREGYIYRDVFHFEQNFVIGTYDRLNNLAAKYAYEEKRIIFFHKESHGGTIDSFEGGQYEKDSENQDSR